MIFRAPNGTGLGPYISKGIIEQQGGTIGVESEGPGKGSTSWFILPLADGAGEQDGNGEDAHEPQADGTAG